MKTSAHEDNCTAAQLRSWAKAILCQRDCEPHDYGLLQQHIPGRAASAPSSRSQTHTSRRTLGRTSLPRSVVKSQSYRECSGCGGSR